MISLPRLSATRTSLTRYVGALAISSVVSISHAQLLYSFETGLDGFEPQGAADSDYISHTQSTVGATDGVMSLAIETGSGFGRDVVVNETSDIGGANYDLFNTVAGSPEDFTLEFDVTFTAESWSSTSDPGGFFQINVFSNSDSAQGFRESFGVVNGSPGQASFVTGSLPATSISLTPDSSFYQLGFGTNGNHTAGPGGEGVTYFVDNIRFTQAPEFTEKLLFSWETPDNGGTPEDESLEGWRDGFDDQPYFHNRSVITSEGVTEGGSALRLDAPQSGFSWASQFTLDSGEEGDPANQAAIDALIDDVNGADRIAFDVTFPDDPGFNAPTFLSLFLNVSDQSGNFFQSPAKQAGNPVTEAGNTVTIEIPTSELSSGGQSVADIGLQDGTFFRFALASNSDDAVGFIIDNFRVLTLVTDGVEGDYNEDGVVDALDYAVWRENLGQAAGTLPNDPNDGVAIGAAQLATWRDNFGAAAAGAAAAISTPEPAGGFLALIGGSCLLLGRRNAAKRLTRCIVRSR